MNDASSSTTEAVGRNLRRLLGEQGISQAELARRLDVDPSTVTLYVRGKINLGVNTLMSMAEVLGCEPCDLLKDEVSA